MLYGVCIFPTEYTLPPGETARLAEERGFDSYWVTEHTHIPVSRRSPWPGGPVLPKEYLHTYDPFVALTAAAMATTTLNVGTSVCLIVERDPITTAKSVASVDQLSGGRFQFGVGGGWNLEEMENHGTDPEKRFGILEERVKAMIKLWTEEEASFHGRHVNFDPVWSYPKPYQSPHPPVLLGGDGPRTWSRVLEFCDGWIPISRNNQPPPNLRERVPELRRLAQAAGRDPDTLNVSVFAAPARAEVITELKEAGVDRAIFLLPSRKPAEVRSVLDEYARLMV